MKNITRFGLTALLLTAVAGGLSAQDNTAARDPKTDSAKKETPQKASLFRPLMINHVRPADQRGHAAG